jgi:GT2 family glycosyltransferase
LHALNGKHELLIIDDASDRDETLHFLERCSTDSRYNIRVIRNSENSGVCYSLNKVIRSSTGDLIAPVDHDDLVDPRGISLAFRYQTYFRANWLYTDEVQIDELGYRINDFFKPNFCKQLLRSVMYINHLQLFSRELFDEVGCYREGFEGSQDHDLALRMSEIVVPHHVRGIAYQWRIQSETHSRKQYRVTQDVTSRSMQALSEHLGRLGHTTNIRIARDGSSTYQTRIVPKHKPRVSIIIPCRLGTSRLINGKEINLLEHCLQSIKKTVTDDAETAQTISGLEVILVLNHEDDTDWGNTVLQNSALNGFCVNDDPEFHFARKCNLGAKRAAGDIFIFLNDDIQLLTNGWVGDVASLLAEEDVACVGGILLNADGTVQSCGDRVGQGSADHYVPDPIPSNVGDPMQRYVVDHETSSVTGAFFCCRNTVFWRLDGFSLAFPNSYQDVDFCLRAQAAKLRCLIAPRIRLFHFESSSRNPTVDEETLLSLRIFHSPQITDMDAFQLWRYQKIRVRLLSISGLRRFRSSCYQELKWFILKMIRFFWRQPRARMPHLIP